jgi:hypothetical protein
MTRSTILQRVAYRTGVGLWKQRVWALAMVVLIPVVALVATLQDRSSVQVAGVQVGGGGDCADTIMAFVVSRTTAVARAAYRCLDPSMAQTMTEEQWVAEAADSPRGSTGPVTRVGEHGTDSGGKIVYFALDAPSSGSVGYMVYLGPNGKILKVE